MDFSPASISKRYCRRCFYDLTGIDPSEGARCVCPECGRQFDAANPRTIRRSPLHWSRRLLRGPLGVSVIVLVVLALGWRHGLLPRPVAATSLGLWRWFDGRYGMQEYSTGRETLRLWWWGDVRSVRAVADVADPSGARRVETYRVARTGTRRYDVRVSGVGVAPASLQRALGWVCGDDMLGITIDAIARDANDEPFSVAGSKDVILSEFIRRYDMTVRGWKRSPEQDSVWVFDPVQRKLALTPVMLAELTGHGPIEMIGFGRRRGTFTVFNPPPRVPPSPGEPALVGPPDDPR